MSDAEDTDLEILRRALVDDAAAPPPDRIQMLRQQVEQGRAAGAFEHHERRRVIRRVDNVAVPTSAPLHRRALLLSGAAAGITAVAGYAAGRVTAPDVAPVPPTEDVSISFLASPWRASAHLINHTWGVELLLDVDGVTDTGTYEVSYATAAGPVAAGSFIGDPTMLMKCRFNAAVLRPDLQGIEVIGPGGDVAVGVTLI